MANEAKWATAASVALETSGASFANALITSCAVANLTSSNTSNYPLADFVLSLDGGLSAAASSSGSIIINLLRQDMNIIGTTDENDPSVAASSTHKPHYLGSFTLPNSAASATSTKLHVCNLENVPILQTDQKFWLENNTGVSVVAGWKLTANPKTYGPA